MQAMRVFEGTLKVYEVLDPCSCSRCRASYGYRIGRDREHGLGGRHEQEIVDDGPIDPLCASGAILGDRKRSKLRPTRTEPEAKGFGCASPARLPLALRPVPINYDPDHLFEGRSPTSLSSIR
jgi:hypothetical protein